MQERLRSTDHPGAGAPPPGPARARPGARWRVAAVVVGGRQTLLDLRDAGGRRETLLVDARPDRTAAASSVAGLRRLAWVRIGLADRRARCEVAGTTRRPVRRRVPLDVALALLDAGVPGLVVQDGGAA